jgi:S-adenosyl methyltransferase
LGQNIDARIAAVADFDASTPSIARVYDYLLGGKDNFAADREVADKLIAAAPLAVEVTRENRQFLARAVTWAANRGIGQFIDLGCGMPTVPNTHQTAQAISPDARVAYVDNDPVVLTHLRALAAKGNPGVTVVDGDVREAAAVLTAVAAGIDLAAPTCLLMGYLLHFFTPEAARDLVAGYVAALAPGSYVVLSAGRADGEAAKSGFGAYSSTGAPQVYNHSVPEFASFFGPLDLVPPGVVDSREWRPDWEQPVHLPARDGQVIAGVARVGG